MKAQFYNKLILWTIIVLSIGWIVYAACDLFGPTFEIFSFVLIIPALPCAHAHRRPAADEQARLDLAGRGVRRAVAKLHCRRDLDSDAALYLIF